MRLLKYTADTFKNTKLPCIGNYVLLEFLGSDTIRAADVHTGKEIICKVFNISRYLETMSIYLQVPTHSNLNQIIDKVLEDSMAYIFFDHNYGDLLSYLRSLGIFQEDEAARLFFQIASVVAHCHEYNVILKDLKLKRFVFIDYDRSYLKLDTLEDAVVANGEDCLFYRHRCSAYTSPEALEEGTMFSGKAADVWCLGVILYTLLVGHYPFHGTDLDSLFRKIKYCQFSIPERLSSKAKCLICNILRPDPVERLTAREILDHPWFFSSSLIGNREGGIGGKMGHDQMVPTLYC